MCVIMPEMPKLLITRRVSDILGFPILRVERYLRKGYIRDGHKISKNVVGPHWVCTREAVIEFLRTYFLLYIPENIHPKWQKYLPYEEIAKWATLREASGKYHYCTTWFRGLHNRGFVKFRWGRKGKITCTFVYLPDVENVIANAESLKPFAEGNRRQLTDGFIKGKPRGWAAEPVSRRRYERNRE